MFCYQRYTQTRAPTAHLAFYALPIVALAAWFLDTGETHHATPDLTDLTNTDIAIEKNYHERKLTI